MTDRLAFVFGICVTCGGKLELDIARRAIVCTGRCAAGVTGAMLEDVDPELLARISSSRSSSSR